MSGGMPAKIEAHVLKRGNLIKELIEPNDMILDVGCGEGIITAILSENCKKATGCDYSTEAVAIAKKNYPKIDFVYSNCTNLKFQDASFKKVVLSDVAEHLLREQFVRTLQEIRRVLMKGGVLIVATPLTGQKKNTSTYAHIYEYSPDEMRNILQSIFRDVKLIEETFGIFTAVV